MLLNPFRFDCQLVIVRFRIFVHILQHLRRPFVCYQAKCYILCRFRLEALFPQENACRDRVFTALCLSRLIDHIVQAALQCAAACAGDETQMPHQAVPMQRIGGDHDLIFRARRIGLQKVHLDCRFRAGRREEHLHRIGRLPVKRNRDAVDPVGDIPGPLRLDRMPVRIQESDRQSVCPPVHPSA